MFNPSVENQKSEFNILPLLKEHGFDDKVNISLTMPSYEVNTPFPLDYRTKKTDKRK